MDTSEIKGLTTKEIIERIENEQNFLGRQRMNHAVSPLDNPMKLKESRRIIARLKTILRQRQMNEEPNS
ncbi:MAG: 50S ribosomal protein L29 [Bacteroidales bacterium]|nr:50S ribosomal protein L29 [Bacteroidales bacterium]